MQVQADVHAFGACLNDFILGSRKMLFVDGTHLSGPYEGTMLFTVALDVDIHIFDVAYAIVGMKRLRTVSGF